MYKQKNESLTLKLFSSHNIKIMSIILIGLVLYFLFGAVILWNNYYKNLEDDMIQRVLQGSERLNAHISKITQQTKDLASVGRNFHLNKQLNPDANYDKEISSFLLNVIKNSSDAFGIGLWYEPKVFYKDKKYYGIYAFREKDSFKITWDYNKPSYDYFKWDWYTTALPINWDRKIKREKDNYISIPFYDPVTKTYMITSSSVIYDNKNTIIGVSTVDWQLNTFRNLFSKINEFPNSRQYIINLDSGLIVAGSDIEANKIYKTSDIEWFPPLTEASENKVKIIDNVTINGEDYNVYYTSTNHGLIYVVVIPFSNLMNEIISSLTYLVVFSIVLAVGLSLILGLRIIKSQKKLSQSEAMYTMFRENFPGMICIFNNSKELIYINKYGEKVLSNGEQNSEIDINFINIISQQITKLNESPNSNLVQDVLEFKNKLTNKTTFINSNCFSLSNQNGQEYYGIIGVDITEKRKVEKIQSAVYKISENVNNTDNLKTLFEFIHQAILELMPAHNFYIAIYNSDKNILEFPYFVDEFDENPGTISVSEKTLSGFIITTGEPLFATPEVFEKMEKEGLIDLVGAPSVDWLGVPLKIKSNVVGIMVTQSYDENVRFTEEFKEILTFVSEQIAMAIFRKSSEEALFESYSELEMRVSERTAQLRDANIELKSLLDERIISENKMKESEERFKNLANAAPVMIWMSNKDNEFTYFNTKWLQFTGLTFDEQLKKNWMLDIHSADFERFQQIFNFAKKHNEIFEVEYRQLDKNDEYKWILNRGEPRFVKNNFDGFIGSCVDITERKVLEEKIITSLKKEMELNNLKTKFISLVSHQYRSPLTSILNSTSIIKNYCSLKQYHDDIPKFVDIIQKSANSMISILEDIMNYSNMQSGRNDVRPTYIEIKKESMLYVKELESQFSAFGRIQLVTELTNDVVLIDANLFQQIIFNLISNAIRFSFPNTPIIYELSIRDRLLHINIQNFGMGIPPDETIKVFEPFYHAKNDFESIGSGMGLSIVKQNIDLLNGRIEIDSILNETTTVKVTLPV